jgi:hypothetical protein
MSFRGGSAERQVSRPPFPVLKFKSSTPQNPLITWLCFEAVYSFRLLSVWTGGRNVNRIFCAVRKLCQGVANGMRFVPGGCSRKPMAEWLPAIGDFFLAEAV